MPKDRSPSDRVQFRNLGELMHPGACALCGSGVREEGYVDPQIYYDYEGQVYFCTTCLEEMAGVIGCLTAAESAHLTETANEALAENKALKEELEQARERLGHYDSILRTLSPAAVSPTGVGNSVTPEQSGTDSKSSGTSASGSADGKPVAKKSTSGRRPKQSVGTTASNPSETKPSFEL